MKNKLSVIQAVITLVAALLTMLDGMFTWITYTMFENISKREISLNNLMITQQICGGPLLYWLFMFAIILMLVYCIIEIFFEDKIPSTKAYIAIPSIITLLGSIMIIACSNYKDTFNYYGETRNVAISMGVLAYIEIALLITMVLIECYKQFKCDKTNQ